MLALIPATCVPWARVLAVDGNASVAVAGAGRRERARDDDFRVGEARLALREAGRHCVAAGIEERVRVIDARVDDPDLHALPCGVERGAPEPGRADRLRRGVELRLEAACVVDVPDARESLAGAGGGGLREHHREAVRHKPVAPAQLRPRGSSRASAARKARCSAAILTSLPGACASGGEWSVDDDLFDRSPAPSASSTSCVRSVPRARTASVTARRAAKKTGPSRSKTGDY